MLRRISTLVWPIAMEDEPAVVQQLGWTVVPGTEGRYLTAETGWQLTRSTADVSSGRVEQLTSITFRVTDIVEEQGTGTSEALDDAFAEIVAGVQQVLGDPASRFRKPPTVTWEPASGGSIVIVRSDAAISVNAYSAKYTKARRTLAR